MVFIWQDNIKNEVLMLKMILPSDFFPGLIVRHAGS